MNINEIVSLLYKEYGDGVRRAINNFKDFKGDIMKFEKLPRDIKDEYFTLVQNNEDRNSPTIDNVSAVLFVKKGGKVIVKFYGANRMASIHEQTIMRKYYPDHVQTIHAEYDAIMNFEQWYTWKEPRKRKRYDFTLLVVRNSGLVPARPCPYCRRMLKDKLGRVELYYPVGLWFFGHEVL